jgi:MinD-like ATPase involved in chromosome partitioning or flagellar assembly
MSTETNHVFISYSRRDTDAMQHIVARLREQGVRVWVDNEKLVPGTPIWEIEIEKAINEAYAVVVVLSPDAKNSEWVLREIAMADQSRKRVFPVLVAGSKEASIPLRLITRQYVDFRKSEETKLQELKTAIFAYLAELTTQDEKEVDNTVTQTPTQEQAVLTKVETGHKAEVEAIHLLEQKLPQIITVHSFKGGTGKTNIVANMATLLAVAGKRVCIIDIDLASPGAHCLFGVTDGDFRYSLNDYLWGKANIEDAALDVTNKIKEETKGKLFLVPSSIKAGEIARILREGYDAGLLNDGFDKLIRKLKLDVLLIDTQSGLNEETLLSMAISNALVIMMRPDFQDYQGTSIIIDVAHKLDVPKMLVVVNNIPSQYNSSDVKQRVESTYGCKVAATIPHSEELMMLASSEIFSSRYPNNPITTMFREIIHDLAS